MNKRITAATLTLGLTLTASGAALAAPALAAPSEKAAGNAAATAKAAARPAPDIVALAGDLAEQEIEWGACDFGDPIMNEILAVAECGVVEVPRDWLNPQDTETFEIAVSRVITVDPASPEYQGTITANPGGPGLPGLSMGPQIAVVMPELEGTHNFFGFDPRGTGNSTHAVCELPADALAAATPEETNKLLATCQDNPDVRAINTQQTVYDMDFLRHLMGAPKLSYIGYSYGTWLGAWYGTTFAANAENFVLDSATGLTDRTLERTFFQQSYARDRQFEEHLMNWIARHDDTYDLGTVPSEIYTDYVHAQEVIGDEVTVLVWFITGGFIAFPANSEYPTGAATVQLIITIADLVEQTGVDPLAILELILDAALDDGEIPQTQISTSDLALLSDPEVAAELPHMRERFAEETADDDAPASEENPEVLELDEPFLWIQCQDGQYDQDLAAAQERADRSSQDNPLSRAFGTTAVSACAYFETDLAKPYPRTDFPQTLLLQTELDSQTAWELGHEAGRRLPNTTLIGVDNEGSHAIFPYGLSTVDNPVRALLGKGERVQRDYIAQGKPLPGDETTWESWQRLNRIGQHVGPNEDNPYQPILITQGNPVLPPEGMPVSELLAQNGDPAVEAAQDLRKLYEFGK